MAFATACGENAAQDLGSSSLDRLQESGIFEDCTSELTAKISNVQLQSRESILSLSQDRKFNLLLKTHVRYFPRLENEGEPRPESNATCEIDIQGTVQFGRYASVNKNAQGKITGRTVAERPQLLLSVSEAKVRTSGVYRTDFLDVPPAGFPPAEVCERFARAVQSQATFQSGLLGFSESHIELDGLRFRIPNNEDDKLKNGDYLFISTIPNELHRLSTGSFRIFSRAGVPVDVTDSALAMLAGEYGGRPDQPDFGDKVSILPKQKQLILRPSGECRRTYFSEIQVAHYLNGVLMLKGKILNSNDSLGEPASKYSCLSHDELVNQNLLDTGIEIEYFEYTETDGKRNRFLSIYGKALEVLRGIMVYGK